MHILADKRYTVFVITSSLLCFLYIALTFLVVLGRRQHRLAYMVNDDEAFVAKFRAHANFAEYVPLALLLMLAGIMVHMDLFVYSSAAGLLIVGRYLHAYSLIKLERKRILIGRVIGMLCTLTSLFILALYNLLFVLFVYLL